MRIQQRDVTSIWQQNTKEEEESRITSHICILQLPSHVGYQPRRASRAGGL